MCSFGVQEAFAVSNQFLPMRKVTASIDIKSTPSKIIDAFLQPNILNRWWSVERCFIEPHSGGLYTLAWGITENGFGYISSGIISIYQPGLMLTIEKLVYLNPDISILGPMTLNIRTQPNENFTILHIVQDGYKNGTDWDWYYSAVSDAWPQVLKILKAYLEN